MSAVGEGGGTGTPVAGLRPAGVLLVAASLLVSGGIAAMVLARRPTAAVVAGYPGAARPAARPAALRPALPPRRCTVPSVVASAAGVTPGAAGGGAEAVLATVPVGGTARLPVTLAAPPGAGLTGARAVVLPPDTAPSAPLPVGVAGADLPAGGGTVTVRFAAAAPGRYRVVVGANVPAPWNCVDVAVLGVVDVR